MARPRAAVGTGMRGCAFAGRASCEGAGRLRCDLAAPTRKRPSGLSSSLSRLRASRCRHRRTCCRSGQNQTSADGTLQQAIAPDLSVTATSRVRSRLGGRRADDCAAQTASISHEGEEVRMGRTKHGLPPRSKSEREFDHEIGNVVFVLNALDAGRLDHLFVDAETKAAVRADWVAKGEAVVRKYVRAYPGMTVRTWHRWSQETNHGEKWS